MVLPRIDAGTAPVAPVRPLQAVEAIGDPRQALFERSLQTLVGKSLPGQVLARLNDGSFVVKVNGTPARMLLPPGAQIGNQVPLTLVSLNPRPTFQVAAFGGGAAMMSEADAGALAASADTDTDGEPAAAMPRGAAGNAAGTGASAALMRSSNLNAALLRSETAAPALDADSRQTVLSPSARVITGVLATAMATADPPTAVHGAAPLLAKPPQPDQGAALAGALKQAIDSSGLFYESHLREWSEGKRPLADLAREPQMQRLLDGAAAARPGAAIDGATAQFINLQLSSHEQARLTWQGQPWPGQAMQWEISKDAPEQRGHAEDDAQAPTAWRSAVRFRFAHLGEINAQLVLVGDQLHLQVRAADSATGSTLQAHAPRLGAALEAAGAPLSSFNIGADV